LLIELGLLLCCDRLGDVRLLLRDCGFKRPGINAQEKVSCFKD
jgi:hypothetical protein